MKLDYKCTTFNSQRQITTYYLQIHIEVLNPAVVSNIQPDTTDPESYVINSGIVIQNITIDSENDIYNVSTEGTIDLHNGSEDLLENIARLAIENESGV